MTNTLRLSIRSVLFALSIVGASILYVPFVHAQYVPGCGGMAVTGITNSCNAITQQCTSGERASGTFSPITCSSDGDPYWNDYGSCNADAACSNPPATISSFTGNPTVIVRGNSTSLTWSSTNATSCTSPEFSTGNAPSGTVLVSPITNTSYNLTCTGPGGASGISAVTINVTVPPFDATCSVSPTSAQIGETVTWSASAWNGTTPYTFSWIGQIIEGLTGPSASVSYSTSGVKTGSIQVTDSTSNGTSVSLTNNDNKICTGPVVASDITPGLQEDGGTQSAMQNEAYSFTRGGFRGGIGVFYDQSYSATYAAVEANPQNYCIDVKLSQRCNPPPGWEGCNWSFGIDIHQGTGLRDPQASDQGPYVPNQNGFGTWNQARFFGAVLGTPVSGTQTINRSCVNSVTVAAAAATTANLSANPISITQGNSSTLTWSSTNATSCTGTNFDTGGATSGSLAVSPAVDTTYTVDCAGSGAPASSSVTVSVTPPPSNVDLTTTSITPTTATALTPLTLSSTASNSGTGASGSFPVLFQVQSPADVRESSYLASVAPGGSAPASISYTFPSAATYQVRACANNNTSWVNIVTESDYTNNCGPWTPITVVAAPPPSGSVSCTVSNPTPLVGETVTYTATPSGGATAPYVWDDSNGGVYGNGSSVNRTFSSAGIYAMSVSAQYAPNTACTPGTITVGCAGPTSATLTAASTRILPNTSTTLSYSISGGVNTSCILSGPNVNQVIPANACLATPAAGSGISTGNLTTQAIYRITCDGIELNKVIINVVPKFGEF